MNRAQRREKMKNRDYRARVKMSAEMAVNTLEKMMEKNWKKIGDETLNQGYIIKDENEEDQKFNY